MEDEPKIKQEFVRESLAPIKACLPLPAVYRFALAIRGNRTAMPERWRFDL